MPGPLCGSCSRCSSAGPRLQPCPASRPFITGQQWRAALASPPPSSHCRCGHCKRLAPAWNQLAESVSTGPLASKHNAKIASVDCTQHSALCAANNVKGYPTLLLFKQGGESIKYSGNRDTASLSREQRHEESMKRGAEQESGGMKRLNSRQAAPVAWHMRLQTHRHVGD